MQSRWLATKPAEKGRPVWGFCRVRPETLCRIWLGMRSGLLERVDLQTWFAAHELLMRRCMLVKGRLPFYSVRELVPLTGLRSSVLRAALRRLQRAGLLSWSEQALVMKDGTSGNVAAVAGLSEMLSLVANHHRTLPIPRHTVLLLAQTRRPVLIATLLGHLFRGMYYRSKECFSWGTCKASWIADAFGVDVRNVKLARRELQRLGWMRPLGSLHWHRQRHGQSFVVCLGWRSKPRTRSTPIPPPRHGLSTGKSPPPDSYRNLPSEVNHQNRPRARLAGVQGQAKSQKEGTPEPRLAHVLPIDLSAPGRTAELFRQAVRAGMVQRDVMAERLWFFAAAERAKRRADNPGGYFVSVLKQRRWSGMNLGDEERAREALLRIPEFYFGKGPSTRVSAPRPPRGRKPSLGPTERATVRELIRHSLASVAGCPPRVTSGPAPLSHSSPL